MVDYIDGLRPPEGGGVRDGVLSDLSTYHGIDSHESVERARRWESDSIAEWNSADRHSAEGVLDFYMTTQSWSFDLLWYCYLQATGHEWPLSVQIVHELEAQGRPRDGARVLDLGSGVGATGALFAAGGAEVVLADVSQPLLDFARFRLERRAVDVAYAHLVEEPLDTLGTFDVIVALDVLAHVPDLDKTMAELRAAIRPGGWLFVTLDARPAAPGNEWHLYEEEWDLSNAIEDAGFVQHHRVGPIHCYQPLTTADPDALRTIGRFARRNRALRSIRRFNRRRAAARSANGTVGT